MGCVRSRRRFGNWSELPSELLYIIILKLDSIEDVASFSSVCRAWLMACRRSRREWSAANPWRPWLLLSENTRDDNAGCVRKAYDPSNNKLYNLKLPETFGRNCWGSGLGWIVTFGLDLEINLLNPLTKSRLSLPSINTMMMPEHLIPLNNNNNNNNNNNGNCDGNCIYKAYWMRSSHIINARVLKTTMDGVPLVAVIHPRKRICGAFIESTYLSIATPGAAKWTLIQTPEQMVIKDVLFWKGLLWFVNPTCSLWYVDILSDAQDTCFKAVELSIEPHRFFDSQVHRYYNPNIYLVESLDQNKLLLVMRFCHNESAITTTITRRKNGILIKEDDVCHKLYDKQKTHAESYLAITKGFTIFVLDDNDISGKKWEVVDQSVPNFDIGNMFLGKNTSLVAATPKQATSTWVYFAGDHVFKSRHDMGIDYGKGKRSKFEALDYGSSCTDAGFSDPFWFTPCYN